LGDDWPVPNLVAPAIAEQSLARSGQPSIRVSDAAVLRPWALEDADAVIRAFADPAIQRWHVRRLDSVSEAHALITAWLAAWATESECHWALVAKTHEALLGRVALKGVNRLDGSAGVAYWVVPAARGRGLCANAVAAVSEWAFRDAGFHRLSIEHSTANPASCRVALKAGFIVEGVRRGAAQHMDGWHDMCLHSRLVTDP
jgi:ribosomal-protein-alanine N-acetyltransferase